MKNESILTSVLIVILVATFALLLSCGKSAAQCPLCERDVHRGMEVKVTHNRIPMQTCCMACALTFQKQTKNVEIKSATDFISGNPVDARNAFYLTGSDVSPCIQDPKVQKFIREPHSALHACYDRCEPGILAFRSRSDAEKFQKEHGGFIREYDRLLEMVGVKGGTHHD